MELVPKAEFSIVTRASSKTWIPELIDIALQKRFERFSLRKIAKRVLTRRSFGRTEQI